MALPIPAELKKINPYIRRAEELDKDKNNAESRLIAYYCRQYAVHVGIPLAATSSKAKECLGIILGDLEKEKIAMDNFSKQEAQYLCTQFANKVFAKANEEDRNGVANKSTAKAFYAAATFLQILDQFYTDNNAGGEEKQQEDEEEIMLKQKEEKNKILYAKWKSTDILKAIKEGRQPTPGGYEEQQQQQQLQQEQEEQQQKQQTGEDDAYNIEPKKQQQQNETNQEEIHVDLCGKVTTVNSDDEYSDANNRDVTATKRLTPPPLAPPPYQAMQPPPQQQLQQQQQPENEEEEIQVEQGQEVQYGLGPPPSYPAQQLNVGSSNNTGPPKPPLSFQAPPPLPPVAFVPPPMMDNNNYNNFMPTAPSAPIAPSPPPSLSPKNNMKKNVKGLFNKFGGGKKIGKVSKAQLSDAVELTKFALAALEDRDAELGASRLEQALNVLRR